MRSALAAALLEAWHVVTVPGACIQGSEDALRCALYTGFMSLLSRSVLAMWMKACLRTDNGQVSVNAGIGAMQGGDKAEQCCTSQGVTGYMFWEDSQCTAKALMNLKIRCKTV